MWPVMVYVFLGNMAHVSMGTFAIISILVNQVIEIFQSNLVKKQLNIGKVTQFGFFRIIISRSNCNFSVRGRGIRVDKSSCECNLYESSIFEVDLKKRN